MIKKELVKTHKWEIVDIICNKCGKSLKHDYAFKPHLKAEYDVYSERDIQIDFVLCHSCLKKLYKTFKIQPDENEIINI